MIRIFLLYPDRDFDFERPLPPQAPDLIQDLALDVLLAAMAQGDDSLLEVATKVLLTGSQEVDTVTYRQEILQDVIRNPEVVRQIYRIPLTYLERKQEQWLWLSSRNTNPSFVLNSGRRLLEASLDLLRRLRQIADTHAGDFTSRGFRRFFAMLQRELDDDYLALVERHVRTLRFPKGVLLQGRLGQANQGTGYTLCLPAREGGWLRQFLSRSPSFSYTLPPRDHAGARALSALRDRGVAEVARTVGRAAAQVESFFQVLRRELAFYLGGLHLYEQLTALGEPVAFPQPFPASERRWAAQGLYDPTLALTMGRRVVGNTVTADGRSLVIITGPNQGGKTTFLRSVGLAQLMLQSGLFAPAEALAASLSTGLFTHFKREEDEALESGKFEEELRRMSAIVDHLRPHGLVLLNESFAATNEREGSEIARQIVRALVEKQVRVFFVTHLYEFARSALEQPVASTLFLRAERLPDGRRTFRLREGPPLATGFGVDLYEKIFAETPRVPRSSEKIG